MKKKIGLLVLAVSLMISQTAQAGQLLLFPIGRVSALDLIPAFRNIQGGRGLRLRRCRLGAALVQSFPYIRFGIAVAQAVQSDKAI